MGFVSQTLIQHENKLGERCRGTGQTPVVSARSAAAAANRAAGGAAGSRPAGKSPKTSPATKGGVSVRKLDVDPEVLKERQERSERLREERAEAARERNAIGFSYFDEPRR